MSTQSCLNKIITLYPGFVRLIQKRLFSFWRCPLFTYENYINVLCTSTLQKGIKIVKINIWINFWAIKNRIVANNFFMHFLPQIPAYFYFALKIKNWVSLLISGKIYLQHLNCRGPLWAALIPQPNYGTCPVCWIV